MSRTPISKYSRFAFTVPTITLLPSTNSRLIRSAHTSTVRLPPVTLDRTSTPFFPSASMLSNTTDELPVASKIRSNGPNCFAPSRIGVSTARSSLRSEEHTSELQSLAYLVCRLLFEKKKKRQTHQPPSSLEYGRSIKITADNTR